MNRIGMPLVVLFGYPIGSDQLVFLGRQDEIVLSLSTEIRETAIQFLRFCNGMRTLGEIRELVPGVENSTFETIVSVCEDQKIICDSREIFRSFHEDSSNPLRFAHSLSAEQINELVESRPRDFPKGNEIKLVLPESRILSSLKYRHSAKGFDDEVVSAEILGGLLASMYNLRDARSVPSAGKLYPLDLYVFVKSEKQSIPRGIYRYNPDGFTLHDLGLRVTNNQLDRVLDSYQAEAASFVFFIAADLERVTAKYSNRGYRYALIETGHVAQNAYLFCAENQLGVREFGGFNDKLAADFLGLQYPHKAVLSVLLVGKESVNKSPVDLASIANRLRDDLVGANKPLTGVYPRSLEFRGDSFPKAAAISRFRTMGPDSKLNSHPDDVSFGLSVSSHEASIKAMAEGFERHASSLVRVDLRAKAAGLDGRFFDPRTATPFSSEQFSALKLDQFDPEKEWEWVIGERLVSQERMYVPVDHIFYPIGPRLGRRLCYRANSSGIAAHFDSGEAKLRGLYELIERDALLVTWHSQRRVNKITPEFLGLHAQMRVDYWKAKGWDLLFLDLTLDSVPVVLAVIYSQDQYPAFVSGACAHPSRVLAGLKALDEAESMLVLAFAEKERKETDLRNVRSPMDHGRLYFDPQNLVRVEWLINPSGVFQGGVRETPDLVSMFDPVVVDLTPPGYTSGLKVFRVLSERLLPIHFGYGTEHYGHNRFKTVDLNWKRESQLFPHFFA